jgi:hypothetical protein
MLKVTGAEDPLETVVGAACVAAGAIVAAGAVVAVGADVGAACGAVVGAGTVVGAAVGVAAGEQALISSPINKKTLIILTSNDLLSIILLHIIQKSEVTK